MKLLTISVIRSREIKDSFYVLFVWIYLNTYLYLMNSKIVLNSVFTFSFVWFFILFTHLWYNSIYFTRNTYRKYLLRFQCFLFYIFFCFCHFISHMFFLCICLLFSCSLSSAVFSFFIYVFEVKIWLKTHLARERNTFSFVIGLFKNSFLISLNLHYFWM